MTHYGVHAEARRARSDASPYVMLEPTACRAQLVSASIVPHRPKFLADKWTLKQVQGDGRGVTVGEGDGRGATQKSSCRGAEVAERHRNSSNRRSSGGWSLWRLAAGNCAGAIDGIGPSLRWGGGKLDSRAPMLQNCHSRESGNPWPDISARDTILVRTKTRRPGATSLCLCAFVPLCEPFCR